MVCFKLSKTLLGLDKDVLCTFTYVPPYQSPYYEGKDVKCAIKNLEDFLLTFSQQDDSYQLVIGDLNARIGDWSFEAGDTDFDPHAETDSYVFSRQSEDLATNQFGKTLIDFCNIFQLTPLNGFAEGDVKGKFTFIAEQGNSVIDYALLSADVALSHKMCFHVEERVESSHSPIHLKLHTHFVDKHRVLPKCKKTLETDKWKWDSNKADEFKQALNSEQFANGLSHALDTIDVCTDSALDMFTENLLKAAECMRRKVRPNNTVPTNRWYDRQCIMKKRAARKALNAYCASRNNQDKLVYRQLRSEYKRLLQEKKRNYRQTLQESLLNDRTNSCKFWDTVKKARSKKKIQPNIDIGNWQQHFQNVYSGGNESTCDNFVEPCSADVSIPQLDKPIGEDEVREAIRNLKLGKAAGLDNVCGEFLKCAEDVVSPFLTKFYNRLFDLGYFPVSWCKSVVIPLFKKGDENLPDNYRGISLLSIVGKVFTAVLNKRLYLWAEDEDKISAEQAGFRKGYSTIDHIFTLVSLIRNKLNDKRGGKVYAAFIDYRKAFDSVDRNKLWQTLQEMKTSTKYLTLFKSMYNSVQACVRWDGELSEFFHCPSGVRQGCLLSPLIFSLFIAEVADCVRLAGKHGIQLIPGGNELFLLLFADDIVLLSSTPTGLQNQLNNLENASKKLGLEVNLEKTKVMVFRKGGFLANCERWFYDGKLLEVVNRYKYLGFMLTTKLSDVSACEEYASKAKGKVFDILKTMWALGNLNAKIFFQLFDAQIKPMLLYASEVWGLLKLDIIETAHLFACKRFLSVSDKTPNAMVYGETGRYPLYIDASIASIRYWLKLVSMPASRIPKQALQMVTNSYERTGCESRTNWVGYVKACLDLHGFGHVWINRGTENERAFLKHLKQKMIDKFKEEWFEKLCSSERFSIYRLFKFDFGFELYLNNITIKRFRDALTRFRLGINELGINKRFQGADVCKNCPFCPNHVEDEIHFLFVCPTYEDLREKVLFYLTEDNCELEYVLLNPDMEFQRQLAMYIFYSLKRREEMLL